MPLYEKRFYAAVSLGALLFCAHCSSPPTTKEFTPPSRESTGFGSTAATNLSSQIPDWVPIYPGAAANSITSKQAGIEHYFNFTLITHDDCPKVIDWYVQKLEAAGYKTYARFDYNNPGCSSDVRSDSADRKRAINVSAGDRVNDVLIGIESVEREVATGVNVGVPSWIPMYPGIKTVDIEASTDAPGKHNKFSFTSRDDTATIYRWYESKLTAMGFQCTFKVEARSAGSFTATSNGRSFKILNFPTPPEDTFVVEVSER